jgi:hypothetical protein
MENKIDEKKQFELLLNHYYYHNDWKKLIDTKLNDWQKDMLIDFFSDIAHDRVMENISYEDFLTEDEAILYRIGLRLEEDN